MPKQKIKLVNASSLKKEKEVDAYIYGLYGVHLSVNYSSDVWGVTHIPTGIGIFTFNNQNSFGQPSKKKATQLAKQLDKEIIIANPAEFISSANRFRVAVIVVEVRMNMTKEEAIEYVNAGKLLTSPIFYNVTTKQLEKYQITVT